MKRYWYKFRVKYGKALDTGKNKKVSEEYLVDAESFTETEKRATKAATELIGTRDFDITAISREPITEILKEDEKEGNHWYKTVVSLVTSDVQISSCLVCSKTELAVDSFHFHIVFGKRN